MNKIIKEQLNLCSLAQIPQFDDDTTSIIITHGESAQDVLQLHKAYLIELEDWFIHPSEEVNVSANCNNGLVPTSKQLKCVPTQFNGKMTKFDAIGFNEFTETDNTDVYMGLWLPRKAFKIIKRLD